MRALLCSSSKQNRLNRFEHNRRVERQALVLDAIKIVIKLLLRVLNRRAIGIFDLSPTSQAWSNQMSLLVVGNLLGELCDEVRPFRPRSDEVHIAAQNVPELRNFINANLANEAPRTRHTFIIGLSPNGAVFFRIDAHRTKLHQRESAAVLADAFLPVENGTAGIQFD